MSRPRRPQLQPQPPTLILAGVLLALGLAFAALAQEGLDLPIEPPRLGGGSTEARPHREEEGDDPRDVPPPTFYGEELDLEGEAIVYVLDASCSMSNLPALPFEVDGQPRTGSRWDRAVAEVRASLSGLASSFRFNVVAYGTAAIHWRTELVEATPANKAAAAAWLDSGCRGATSTGPSVVGAFPYRAHMVLLTDGAPNWDGASVRPPAWHRDLIRHRNEQPVRIDVFGVSLSGAARSFCQGVAADAGGTYFEVP